MTSAGYQQTRPSPGWDARLRWWLTTGRATGKLPPHQWFTAKGELRCALCTSPLTPEEHDQIDRRAPPHCDLHAQDVQALAQEVLRDIAHAGEEKP